MQKAKQTFVLIFLGFSWVYLDNVTCETAQMESKIYTVQQNNWAGTWYHSYYKSIALSITQTQVMCQHQAGVPDCLSHILRLWDRFQEAPQSFPVPPNQSLVLCSTTQITQHLCHDSSWTLLSAERRDHCRLLSSSSPFLGLVSVGSHLSLFKSKTNFNFLPCHKTILNAGKAFALRSCYSHLSSSLNAFNVKITTLTVNTETFVWLWHKSHSKLLNMNAGQ